MPKFIADFDKFCAKHIGYVIILVFLAMGSMGAVAGHYVVDLMKEVSKTKTDVYQIIGETRADLSATSSALDETTRQMSQYIRSESEYRREVRELLKEQSSSIGMIQTDIAVLRNSADRRDNERNARSQ